MLILILELLAAVSELWILLISLHFEQRDYLREGVERAVRSGSPCKATAIQAADMRLHPVGLHGERLINARSTPSSKYSRCSKQSEIASIILFCYSLHYMYLSCNYPDLIYLAPRFSDLPQVKLMLTNSIITQLFSMLHTEK